MSRLASRAEQAKLARELGVPDTGLDFLADLPPEALRHFRVAVTDLFFDEQRLLLRWLASVARWLPSWLSALLARLWLGSLLTARLASELPAWRVAEIARHLSPGFMADIATRLDPRGARELVQLLAPVQIVAVTQVLLARRDFITMGRFVALLPDEVVSEAAEAIADEGDLVQAVFYIEARNRLDHLVRVLPRERVERAILMVCDDSRRDLWPALLALVSHVGYGLRRELGDLAAAQGEGVLNAIVRAAQEDGLWEDLLPVVACLSPEVQRQVVNLDSLQAPTVMASIIRATEERDLWTAMLALAQHMNEAGRDVLAQAMDRTGGPVLEHASHAALLRAQWHTALDIVRRMPVARHQECLRILARYLDTLDAETATQLTSALQLHGIGVPAALTI